jgi:hypothetical protein
MIDDLRNLFGDMLSGKMKDSEIALTKQESAILRLKVEGLIDSNTELRDERVALRLQIETLRSEISVLRLKEDDQAAIIADLTAQLQKDNPVHDRLDEPTAKVLKLLFDHGDGLDIDSIRSPFGFSVSEAKFHIGILMDLKFIEFQEGLVGFAHSDAFGESHYSGGSPDVFYIQQKGRAYIMKNG